MCARVLLAFMTVCDFSVFNMLGLFFVLISRSVPLMLKSPNVYNDRVTPDTMQTMVFLV